jgi:hypothetical protein
MEQFPKLEKLRMAHWLLVSALLYGAAMTLAAFKGIDGKPLLPQLQIVFWKLGHITMAAHAGYWIDKTTFRDKLLPDSDPARQDRRAKIMAACIIAVALGM